MQIYLVFYPSNELHHDNVIKLNVDLNKLELTTIKIEALFWYVITNLRKRPPSFLRRSWVHITLMSAAYRSTDPDLVDIYAPNRENPNSILPAPIKIWGSKTYSITYHVKYEIKKRFGVNYPYFAWKRRQEAHENAT